MYRDYVIVTLNNFPNDHIAFCVAPYCSFLKPGDIVVLKDSGYATVTASVSLSDDSEELAFIKAIKRDDHFYKIESKVNFTKFEYEDEDESNDDTGA